MIRTNSLGSNHRHSKAELKHSPVSVVIPCFNEADSISPLKSRLSTLVAANDPNKFKFILVDDGSSDGTREELFKNFGDDDRVVVISHKINQGLTAAILTGIAAADTDWVVSIDSDCTYDPMQISTLLSQAREGVDMVIGSPYHPQGTVKNVPLWRLVLSKIANRIYRYLFRSNLHCYTSCFRAYRRSKFCDLRVDQFGFVGMTELVWRLEQTGSRIIEVPATLDVRQFGQSKLRLFKEITNHLRLIKRIVFGPKQTKNYYRPF